MGPSCAWCDQPATARTERDWPACAEHAARDAKLAAAVRESAARMAEVEAEAREAASPIIRYADMGGGDLEFDEFIAHNATIHAEAMGPASWWIGVTLADGRSWAINLGAKNDRAAFFAICEED